MKIEMYPKLTINPNKNPNRAFALPLAGFIAKSMLMIPQFLEIIALVFVAVILSISNSIFVLFQGRYVKDIYEYNLGLMRLTTKVYCFMAGLTDQYPGFNFKTIPGVSLDIPYPTSPNRWFAFPIFGGVIRFILLIPYFIYENVLQYGSQFGVAVSSIPVLFVKRYPESTYEFARDSLRVSNASSAFLAGLSDNYPSFHISMNHKKVKIALIIIGILWTILRSDYKDSSTKHFPTPTPPEYQSQVN